MSYRFRWDAVWNSLDFLMAGLQMTLFLSATTLVLAMIGRLIIAGLDMSRWRILRWIGVSFGEIIRNTPILVQLLWVYYVLPIVFNVGIGAVAALIIGLSVYQASFISEVYRAHPGGAQGAPRGRAGAGIDPGEILPPHRAAAGHSHDLAAASLEFRAAHQVLVPGGGDFGQ